MIKFLKIQLFFLLIICCFDTQINAQAMKGLWKGEFDYKTIGKDQIFSVEMYFHTVGNKLYGIGASYPNVGNSSGIQNTKWKIEGEWSNNTMTYIVSEIIHYKGTTNLCQSTCKYEVSEQNGTTFLLGECTPTGKGFDKDNFSLVEGNNCKPIDIRLSKKNSLSMYINLDDVTQLLKEHSPQVAETPPSASDSSASSPSPAAATSDAPKTPKKEEPKNNTPIVNKPATIYDKLKTTTPETEIPVAQATPVQETPVAQEAPKAQPTNQPKAQATSTPSPRSSGGAKPAVASKKKKAKPTKSKRQRTKNMKQQNRKRNTNYNDCPFG